MNALFHQLSQFLEDQQPNIIERWGKSCEQDDALSDAVSKLDRKEFSDNIPDALEILRECYCNLDRVDWQDKLMGSVSAHGHHRWKQGFSLRQLIRDWGLLNRSLVGYIEHFFEQNHPEAHAEQWRALDTLSVFMLEATSNSVRRFDELRRAEALGLAQDLENAHRDFIQATQSRGALLREAAHDIRGSLSAIAGASAVLKISHEANDSFSSMLDSLDNSIDSVKDMLNSLLDLSRLEAGQDPTEYISVDIADTLDGLVSEYQGSAQAKGLQLTGEGVRPLRVETDPEKVKRIVQNLLTNAIEHTGEGEVSLHWQSHSDHWTLSIADSGPGMDSTLGSPIGQQINHPPEGDKSINTPTAHAYSGEGIGLTIVKRLCELLQASISLESHPSQGSTFVLVFPSGYHTESSSS